MSFFGKLMSMSYPNADSSFQQHMSPLRWLFFKGISTVNSSQCDKCLVLASHRSFIAVTFNNKTIRQVLVCRIFIYSSHIQMLHAIRRYYKLKHLSTLFGRLSCTKILLLIKILLQALAQYYALIPREHLIGVP